MKTPVVVTLNSYRHALATLSSVQLAMVAAADMSMRPVIPNVYHCNDRCLKSTKEANGEPIKVTFWVEEMYVDAFRNALVLDTFRTALTLDV